MLGRSLEEGNRFASTAVFHVIGNQLSVLIEVPGLPNGKKHNPLITHVDMVAFLNANRIRYTSLACVLDEVGGSKFTFLALVDITEVKSLLNVVNQVNNICLRIEVLRSNMTK